jgi:16S rRNA (guanine966-N2)-methyltransferase
MRIVAGTHRGRKIAAPQGTSTRPTSDRVREAIFSRVAALRGDLANTSVLDAFAGSGALGLEALSRGATRATFVERERPALEVLRSNVERLGVEGSCTVLPGDVYVHAASGTIAGAPFSLLFLDPPYRIDESEVRGLVDDLHGSGSLAPGALIVWEHASDSAPELGESFEDIGRKTYGSTHVSWYRLT